MYKIFHYLRWYRMPVNNFAAILVADIAAAFNWFICLESNELLKAKTRNLCSNLSFPFKPCISAELLIFSFKMHKYCSGDHFPLKLRTLLYLAASCSLCTSLYVIFLGQTCSSNKVNGSIMIFSFNEQAEQRCVCIMCVALRGQISSKISLHYYPGSNWWCVTSREHEWTERDTPSHGFVICLSY